MVLIYLLVICLPLMVFILPALYQTVCQAHIPARGGPVVYETPHIAMFIPHAVGYPASPTTSSIIKKNRPAIMPLRKPIKII